MSNDVEMLDQLIEDALSKGDDTRAAWAKAARAADKLRKKLFKKYGVDSLEALPDSELDAVERIEFLAFVLPIETATLEAYARAAEGYKP